MSERTLEADTRHANDGYSDLEQSMRAALETFKDEPLFTTMADNVFDLYLEGLPPESRQHYNCHACKHFLNRYGGLVTVSMTGQKIPVMWSIGIPPFFQESANRIKELIRASPITGVFLSKEEVLGTPETGEWTHLHTVQPKPFKEGLHSANEVMAEKRADYLLLRKSLNEIKPDAVDIALNLLKTDSLYRSEKVLGPVEWFKALQDNLASTKDERVKENLIWVAVALAPTGYCHIKNTVAGSIFEDLEAGYGFEDIARRFAAKMHPLQYQRPQAAPSAGNIARAEEVVKKLGIEKSLERRFARLDEIAYLWKPAEAKPEEAKPEGVFSHIKPKGQEPVKEIEAPRQDITWQKFFETVLPEALEIEYYAPDHGNYCGILTAEHSDAPPILQWDHPEKRNPFSWYFYHGGSPAHKWGITPGWQKVTAITNLPSMWQEGFHHQGKAVIFVLEGAKDSRTEGRGNALFPETLRADLREVRSTIEAYSKSVEIKGYDQASACGVGFPCEYGLVVRVRTPLGHASYRLDRWD